MKKCISIVFLVLALCYVSVGLYPQSSNAEQRIIGTWTAVMGETKGSTWTFNSNGTFELTFEGEKESGKYWITSSKLAIEIFEIVADFYISTDGRTLILTIFGDSVVLVKRT